MKSAPEGIGIMDKPPEPSPDELAKQSLTKIKNKIMVMSGKGGVGKSMVTALLARALKKQGLKIGVMDSDITGPSMPRMLNVEKTPIKQDATGIMPAKNPDDIPVISINLMMKNESDAVIWRGPLVSNVVKQFWTDVFWGELDVLLVDLPPGTGDVALTVMQSMPLTGLILVSTPHDMVSMIVKKAANMADKLHIPVVGVVQNMVYMHCPECGKRLPVFDDPEAREAITRTGIRELGELPLIPGLHPMDDWAKIQKPVDGIVRNVRGFLSAREQEPKKDAGK